jgi:hypothetical protein
VELILNTKTRRHKVFYRKDRENLRFNHLQFTIEKSRLQMNSPITFNFSYADRWFNFQLNKCTLRFSIHLNTKYAKWLHTWVFPAHKVINLLKNKKHRDTNICAPVLITVYNILIRLQIHRIVMNIITRNTKGNAFLS